MRSIRLRPGLTLWTGVWLLVALVPGWRLRAVRQWTNPSASASLARESGFGLTPDLEREAARRFPDDVAAQLAPLHGVEKQDVFPNPAPGQPVSVTQFNAAMDAAQKTVRGRAVAYFARYDELERRFPNSNAVRAQRLRDSTTGGLLHSEGPFAKGEVMPPGLLKQQVWLARAELESSLGSAREGARREPDNGFYPWMQAVLLFALDKPDEGIKALDAAGRCSRWSDDTAATVARRLALLRRFHVVDWQDEDLETWGMPLPHLARTRALARAAMGQMRLARGRGDEARALEIAGTLARAGANMARGEDSLISALVGAGICQIAWHAAIEDDAGFDLASLNRSNPAQPQETSQQVNAAQDKTERLILEGFIVHARKHGRSDLAQQALTISASLDAKRLGQHFFQSGPGVDAVSRSAGQLSGAYALGVWTLWLASAGSLAWFACWLFTLGRSEETRGARAQTLAWSFFCLGASGVLLWSRLSFGSGNPNALIYQFSGGETPAPPQFAWLINLVPYALPVLWLAPVVLGVALSRIPRSRMRLRRENGALDWKRIAGLSLCGFIAGGLAILYLTDGSKSALVDQIVLYVVIAWCLCIILAHVLFIVWAPRDKRLARFVGLGALWLGVTALLMSMDESGTPFSPLLVLGAALVLGLASLFLGRRAGASRDEGALSWPLDLAIRGRIAAGVLALGMAVGYLGIALWTIPIEHRAHRELSRQLQIGEVAFLREQLAQNPAPR